MKRLLTALMLLTAAMTAGAASKKPVAPGFAWRTMAPLGLHEPALMDTALYDYPLRSVPSEVSTAWASTGNLGGEGINMVYAERPAMSSFFFNDALAPWMPDRDSHTFYNTRVPMTLLSYNTGGGRDNEQNRLKGTFSGNVNKRLQIGAMLDYLYSKGSYNYQAVNDLTWGATASYMGERWQLQAAYHHWNLLNKENGGITDPLYITDPAELQGGDDNIDAKTIPTRLSAAHTRVVGGQLYLNNRYNVGFWKETPVNDTLVNRSYVPVMSFIWTLDYRDDKHLFYNTDASEAAKFWSDCYINPTLTRDETQHWSVKNTVGLSMLEGFNKWVPFGLAAYATHEVRRYTLTADTTAHSGADRPEALTPWPEGLRVPHAKTQNLLWVGGQLTRQQSALLKFDATAEFGLIGAAIGEVKVNGSISTRFRMLGDSVTVRAHGSFRNEAAPWLMNNYLSNFFVWHNDFGKIRRTGFGGLLDVPHTGTRLTFDLENVQNLIYFGSNGLPVQHGSNVQVISASLLQRLHVGILHWDNKVVFQTSTDDNVIPLPKLAVNSNLYLWFKVARVLQVQFGVNCDYYTRYYAPNYQPATMAFTNQHETLVGNYPFMNAYANFKLKKARFYVMFSHFNQGWTGRNYFALPNYPMNPRRFQMGVAIDFAN
ncbi:MAG: putative porin [Bacteroides sp.]|nr:putative porin [Bacteroides sp.]